jgi:enamine deaminase RidA (YjgF/YER057c/UK114 family)
MSKEVHMTRQTISGRLRELGIEFPDASGPRANYAPFVQTGNLLFIAGQICQWNGERRYIGKLGREISLQQGREAARLCGLNIIAHLRTAVDDELDRVARCVRLGGFVNSDPDFLEQPQVINGCSDVIVEVFGDKGRHARAAVGVAVLPFNVAVEVDGIFELH